MDILVPYPPNSPLAYNEDEIVGLITEIYVMLIALCYYNREDVVFPPADTSRHILKSPLVQELTPRAVSLLERIPYCTRRIHDRPFLYPYSFPINYLDEEEFRLGREPLPGSRGDAARKLQPHDVAISTCFDPEGTTLISDTEGNSIQRITGPSTPEENKRWDHDIVYEFPDTWFAYRNYPGYHAASVLRNYIGRLKSLSVVPNSSGGRLVYGSLLLWGGKELRSILNDEYGWPENFGENDWARHYEGVWEDASNRAGERLDNLTEAENNRMLSEYPEDDIVLKLSRYCIA
ncbi:hypothetical protein FALBO_5635 [Fusarium albosuccineum]|uniref:Uncharacterized protein n=1 Tax=Fusarium albosuccineum TaxID=1237068 RepID=A0A8H4LG58_9HYPO|nr:hypothetical protein FALBO_5635 [Fusarium albosuccineum]